MASLEVAFINDLGDTDKTLFLDNLWGIKVDPVEVEEYSSYFQWLDSQIKRYRNERDQDEPEVARLNIKTYGGFLLLVDFVKASHHVKREDIIERFLEHGPFTDRINNGHIKLQPPIDDVLILDTILLAIKAWTMVALDDSVPGEPVYRWKNHESLNDTLRRYLPLERTLYQDTPLVSTHYAPPSPLLPQHQQPQQQQQQQPPQSPLSHPQAPQQPEQPQQQTDQQPQQQTDQQPQQQTDQQPQQQTDQQPQQQTDQQPQQQTDQQPRQQQQANGSLVAGSSVSSTAVSQQDQYASEDADRDREFEGFFTFHDMYQLSSFKIRWTNNFLSHLRVRKLREPGFTVTIFVFHHAAILPALANGYALEALETLGLLIPSNNSDCMEWFLSSSGPDIDPKAGCQLEPSRFVHEFCMWRTNLLTIEREFNNSAPRSLKQWWKDRRRRREWFPFWVAAVVVLLTVVSLLLSLISAVVGVISAKEAVAARGDKNDG